MAYPPAGPLSPAGRRQRQKPQSPKTTREKCWFGCACRHTASHATIYKKQKLYKGWIPPAGKAEVARRWRRRWRLQPRREKAQPAGSSLRRQWHCLTRRYSQWRYFLNPICFAVPLEPGTSLLFTVDMVQFGQQGAAILVFDLPLQAQLAIAFAERCAQLTFDSSQTLDFFAHVRQLVLEHGLDLGTRVGLLPQGQQVFHFV